MIKPIDDTFYTDTYRTRLYHFHKGMQYDCENGEAYLFDTNLSIATDRDIIRWMHKKMINQEISDLRDDLDILMCGGF